MGMGGGLWRKRMWMRYEDKHVFGSGSYLLLDVLPCLHRFNA